MHRWLSVLALGTALVLGGCASVNPEVRTVPGENSALIFGYFDMKDAPFELGCVRITQNERSGVAYRQSCMTTLPNGLFFLENAPPMSYHVPFFYAGGKLHMISSSEKDLVTVGRGEIRFLGAFKYGVVERNLAQALQIKPEQYSLRPVRQPGEAEVLRMVRDQVKDPALRRRIDAQLARMRR